MNKNKSQNKNERKNIFKRYLLPFFPPVVVLVLSVLYTEWRSARVERESEEVKLTVTLDEFKHTATTSQPVIPDTEALISAIPNLPSGDWKLQSSLSTVRFVSNERIPVYTITNLSKRPVNISNICFKVNEEDTYWYKGWWDATGDTLINPPYHFHLNPDTAIRLTTKYPVDTIGINIHSIFITLASGEVKEFAPQWREEDKGKADQTNK